MSIITIDTDKLQWIKMTSGSLEWVNEVDLVNAIITPKELKDIAIKIDAAYQDGYEQGYEQARIDYKKPQGFWKSETNICYTKYICSECGEETLDSSNFCPNCGAKMEVDE